MLALLILMVTQVNAEEMPVAKGHVARAVFTTRIVNREPVDRVLVLKSPATEAYFFTDLRNLQGHTVTHRWEYQGRTVSNVPFVVGGDRWRVYSKKVFPVDSFGEWSVTVFDDNGWPCRSRTDVIRIILHQPLPRQVFRAWLPVQAGFPP